MKHNFGLVFLIMAALMLSFLSTQDGQAAPTATLTVTKTADTNDGSCDSDCSLREAIAAAAAGDTIVFAGGLSDQTILLDPSLGHLNIAKNVTIDGSSLTLPVSISGGGTVRVLWIQSGYTVSLYQLKIVNGAPTSSQAGGGIFNVGNLTLYKVVLSGNTANSASGGGLYNAGTAVATINLCTFENNKSLLGSNGGAIYNAGTVDITNSTFTGNEASRGAAIYNLTTLTITNSTFGSNAASSMGGAIYNYTGGSLNVTNSTFSENSAAANGGALYNAATLHLKNTILANSLPAGRTDCYNTGTVSTDVKNLIETNAGGANACGTPVSTDDPVLAPLATYGGATNNFALLPGSPALEAGDNAICAASPVNNKDQRGHTRPMGGAMLASSDVCDIGAFESTGFWLRLWTNEGLNSDLSQSTPINTLFSKPLGVSVEAIGSNEPVVGGILTYTAPATGASATAVEPIVLVAGSQSRTGYATVNVTANSTYGMYNAYLSGNGLFPYGDSVQGGIVFELTNCHTSIVVQNTNDSGLGSLREALKCTCLDQANTVSFSNTLSGATIRVASQLEIDPNRTVTVDGSALASPVTISGDSDGDGDGDTRVLIVEDNVSATLNGLQITNGFSANGGGLLVNAGGALTLNDSTISHNTAGSDGGGIYMTAGAYALAIDGSTISHNTAGSEGGGIYMPVGARGITIDDSLLDSNSSAASGAAIWGEGKVFDNGSCTLVNNYPLIITNSLITANRGHGAVYYAGEATITDSTFSYNVQTSGAVFGPGLAIDNGGLSAVGNAFIGNGPALGGPAAIYYDVYCNNNQSLEIKNNTFSGNSGSTTVSVSSVHNPVNLINNTFSGNFGNAYADLQVFATTINLYNNLFANPMNPPVPTCNLATSIFETLILNADKNLVESAHIGEAGECPAAYTDYPALGLLAANGGATQTHALTSSSIAIDTGSPAHCPAYDQRGVPRNDLNCDIGAFELDYADNNTVFRPVSADTLTTFGPALAGIRRDPAAADPGVVTITRDKPWISSGPETISAVWEITSMAANPFSVTLQLCYTDDLSNGLALESLRFWQFKNNLWSQVGGTPQTSTDSHGNHCAQISGVSNFSTWTLATQAPTSVKLLRFESLEGRLPGWALGLGSGGLLFLSVLGLFFRQVYLQKRVP